MNRPQTSPRAKRRCAALLLGALVSSLTLAQRAAVEPVNLSQPNNLSLPLVSVGDRVGWKIGAEHYRLYIPQAAASRTVQLEVYSPDLNRADYADARNRQSYYGDELYAQSARFETRFRLAGRGAATVLDRRFSETRQHRYLQLLNAPLEAGYYPLTIDSSGNGKNSFQLRATAGARVEASQFTVNARGQFNRDQVVAFLDVGASAVGGTIRLENYDADGASEMALTLVLPGGERRALEVSGDTRWATAEIPVTAARRGSWKIVARVLPTTRQFSNSVAFRFALNDKPLFALVPGFTSSGTPEPAPPLPPQAPVQPEPVKLQPVRLEADAVACGLRQPLAVRAALVAAPGQTPAPSSVMLPTTLNLAPGEYTLEGPDLPGATSLPRRFSVQPNTSTRIALEYRVQSELRLEVEPQVLRLGQSAVVTAVVSTAFEAPPGVPVRVLVGLPLGLEATGPTQLDGRVSSGKPLRLSFPVRATQPLQGAELRASLEPNCGVTATARLTALEPPRLVLTKTVDRASARTGERVNFTVTVSNVGGSPAREVLLEDALPPGLQGENLRETVTLEPGASRAFSVPATVTAAGTVAVTNTATARFENTALRAEASLRLEPPPAAPARVTLEKTVDRDIARPGERLTYTITARNSGGTTARDLRLEDLLPEGLEGRALSESFELEPGSERRFELEATLASGAAGEIVNTATLSGPGLNLSARASLTVQPAPPAPAQLRLEKTVDRASVRPGEAVSFTITVTNVGGSPARDLLLEDALPEGLIGAPLKTRFDLAAGASRSFTVPATIAPRASEAGEAQLTNTALVTLDGTTQRASASLRVVPIAPATLIVNAVALYCGTRTPLRDVGFTVGGTASSIPASSAPNTLRLPPGTYTVQPEALRGARVAPITVTLSEAQTATVTLEYAPQVTLGLEPTALHLKLGERVTLTATARTDFPRAIPASITLRPPAALEASGATTLEGSLSSAQPLVLSLPVRAIGTGSASVSASLGCDASAEIPLEVSANPLPNETRESEILVLAQLETPPSGGYVVLSDRLPENARLIPGSSRRLTNPSFDPSPRPSGTAFASTGESKPIPDPWVSGDRLFWVFSTEELGVQQQRIASTRAAPRGALLETRRGPGGLTLGVAYRVAHSVSLEIPRDPALIVVQPDLRPVRDPGVIFDPNTPAGRLVGAGEARVVQGDPSVLQSFALARPLGEPTPSTGTPPLNPASPNPAVRLEISFERVTNDPADRPTLVIRAFDRDGLPPRDEFVTLTLNVEPLSPDAAPDQPGYQVRLVNGVARVRFDPPSSSENPNAPAPSITAEARLSNENGTISSSARFSLSETGLAASDPLEPSSAPVSAANRPFIVVGIGSLQANLGLDGAFSIAGGLRAFARGTVLNDWLLTLGLNWQANYDGSSLALSGSLLPSANPFERFPLLGDSAGLGSDLRSSEGVYVRLERGPSYTVYGQINPLFTGQLTAYSANFNGAQVYLREPLGTGLALSLNAFAALVPNATQRTQVRGDGTGLYRLPNAPVEPGSELVRVVVYDRNDPGARLEVRELRRLEDYTLDFLSGVIQLSRPLNSTDARGNPQFLEVEFASSADTAPRVLRFGSQLALSGAGFTVTATALQYRPDPAPLSLLGFGLAFRGDTLQVALESTFSGEIGNGGGLGLAGQLSYTVPGAQFQVRYQERFIGYLEPSASSFAPVSQPGRSLQAGLALQLSSSLALTAALEHDQNFVTNAAQTSGGAQLRANFGSFSAFAGGLLRFSNTALTPDGAPINAGGFLTFGADLPLGALRLGATQRLPLTPDTSGETELRLEYSIGAGFALFATDTLVYEWNGVRQNLNAGVRGSLSNAELIRALTGAPPENGYGSTSIAASYDLDGVSGAAGRARVGLDTTIPLGAGFSSQFGGEAVLEPGGAITGGLSLGLAYDADATRGSARAQLSFQPAGLKQVYSFGAIIQATPRIAISPSLEYTALPAFETLPSGATLRDGGRFSIAAAIREDDWSLLTNHTGRFGIYAPSGDTVQGEIQFGYAYNERLFLRASAAYKFTPGVFTAQFGVGGTYFVTDAVGLGAQAAYLFQPVTGVSRLGFGLEASLRVAAGWIVTGGFNFVGFNGIGSFSAAPGFYIRLDFLFDESMFAPRR